MNLKETTITDLCQIQEKLDNRIITEKKIEWTPIERFRNTVTALDVELSEFANEARWFKRWSNNQEPNSVLYTTADVNDENIVHYMCVNSDCGHQYDKPYEWCEACGSEGSILGFREKYPLLEEYVDALHFFLSLANQRGWQDHLFLPEEAIMEVKDNGFAGGLNGVYLEIKYNLTKMAIEADEENYFIDMSKRAFCFKNAWFLFIAIGLIEYKFTMEQIFEAYLEKNKENHKRQDSGY